MGDLIDRQSDTISRQAAIEKVRQLNAVVSPIFDDVLLVDKAEAMTELMIMPSAEPELATNLQPTCNQLATDCISRQAVKNVIFDMHIDGEDGVKKALPNTYGADLREIIEQIDALPSAQPDWNEMIVICDCCGHAIHVKRQ